MAYGNVGMGHGLSWRKLETQLNWMAKEQFCEGREVHTAEQFADLPAPVHFPDLQWCSSSGLWVSLSTQMGGAVAK